MSAERLKKIADAVGETGRLSVAELAELTGASEMTIRRDLEVLADQGSWSDTAAGPEACSCAARSRRSPSGPRTAWRSSGGSPSRSPR